ncbi:amidase family protein [Paenibacillus sp. SC116]|uniref:amidase family protein n=1 Tax=Paenibacillus sp. SC116 TaxID=2968986 RepID=UPI00215B43C9|nr:amidase family protein [Paenibacillus sp. SC116]MCR8844943.1 amidase family protein [Paenibacillus sp. SC116]
MKKKNTTFKAFLAIMLIATILPWNVASAQGKQAAFDPFEKSINEVSYALNSNQTTSEELVEYYLKRIEAFDDQGPAINSITIVNDNALEQAKALDAERKAKGPRSELHGIPFVVKDNFDVVGMPTTAGSVALKNEYPNKNSFVVQKLIDAGAIVIGKTNMSELAASYGRLGYSSFGGQTLNPYNLNRDASGSSSGSAAAVAANFAVFGLGTDTSGSVRGPAHTTSLVGIRPTMGLTSRTGVVPSSLSLDVTGPMARSVEDASMVLTAMAGKDKADKATKHANRHVRDYAKSLNANALKHARIGVATDFFGDNAEVDAVTNQAIAQMQSMGTEVVPVTFSEQTQYLWTPILGPIDSAEFKSQFETYLSTLPAGGPKTLQEVIAILESPEVLNSATPANPARVEGLKAALEKANTLNSKEYKKIVKREVPKTREEIEDIMDDYDLDAIVFPTMSCPASNTFDKVDPTYVCNAYDTYAAGYMASATGFPEVTVPAGTVEAGMPVGISFFGTAFSEQTLLNLAYSFEQATHARTVPVHTPNLNQ